MERIAINQLLDWKKRADKKPLIINGARQVGKTWLMKYFGKKYYKNTAYINFETNERMKNLFSVDLDVNRLLVNLAVESGQKIDPTETLMIFDEIQECPKALTSLKYFYENAPKYNIIAAGSLLGVALHDGTSFPVGKVEFMDMHPLTFYEFLDAMGEKGLCDLLKQKDYLHLTVFKDKFIDFLRQYFYVGGMPEVVLKFSKNNDFALARATQRQILEAYERDFSKHIPASDFSRVKQLWKSIPAQLSKENKKFIYKNVKSGAANKTHGLAMEWLVSCGFVHRVARVSKPALPLKGYETDGAFKLFLLDVGLLSAMSVLDVKALLEGDALFKEYKGALTEQFVCQELKTLDDVEISYWTNSGATAEVDFLLQLDGKIIPIEVKSTTNLKAKSLKVYQEKFNPLLSVRSSLADYKKTDNLHDIPLYALAEIRTFLDVE